MGNNKIRVNEMNKKRRLNGKNVHSENNNEL